MKRILLIIFSTILLLNLPLKTAYSEDYSSAYQEAQGQLDQMLSDFQIGFSAQQLQDFSLGDLWGLIRESVSAHIHAPLRLLGAIFLVIAAVAVMNSLVGEGLTGSFRGLNELVATRTSMGGGVPGILEIM